MEAVTKCFRAGRQAFETFKYSLADSARYQLIYENPRKESMCNLIPRYCMPSRKITPKELRQGYITPEEGLEGRYHFTFSARGAIRKFSPLMPLSHRCLIEVSTEGKKLDFDLNSDTKGLFYDSSENTHNPLFIRRIWRINPKTSIVDRIAEASQDVMREMSTKSSFNPKAKEETIEGFCALNQQTPKELHLKNKFETSLYKKQMKARAKISNAQFKHQFKKAR